MGWHTIRRITDEDRKVLIPRLEKFCRGKGIAFDYLGIYGDEQKLRWLESLIWDWIEDGEMYGDKGARAQAARRIWRTAVKEDNAEFGTAYGYIGRPELKSDTARIRRRDT